MGIDSYNVTNVPQENILLTVAFLIPVSTVVWWVIIIMVMNRKAGGGGAKRQDDNSARAAADELDNKVNFSNVG